MNWIRIDAELPSGDFVQQIKINGKKLCVIRCENKIHVVQNSCPHAGGILSDGWCKEKNIVCPIHRYAYNLETGRGLPGQGDYIDVYPTQIKDNGIYVGFKESLWQRIFGKQH